MGNNKLSKLLPFSTLRIREVKFNGLGSENFPLNKSNQFSLYSFGEVAKASKSKARPILTWGTFMPAIW